MDNKCPKCGSVIYSRRNPVCGVCGEKLPAQLLFNPEQKAAIERELAEAKRRAREAASRDTDRGTDPMAGGLLSSTDF